MFGNRYFAARYFTDRYFPPGGDGAEDVSAQATPGILKPRKHRWAVWTEFGYRYFDTAEEAYQFLYPQEEPEEKPRRKKKIPKARVIGPAPRITYAGQDVSRVIVEGKRGDELLGDKILAQALQKRIEATLEKRRQDEIEQAKQLRLEEKRRKRREALERERIRKEARRQERLREQMLLEALALERARNDNEAIELLLLAA